MPWPTTPEDLEREQEHLAALVPPPWTPGEPSYRVAGCAVVFGRAGRDAVAWAAAVIEERSDVMSTATAIARVDVPYQPAQLALREGPILEAVVRLLARRPDVLLVAAAGRDHPRRAGLALHLGAVLDVPTAGVTDEPLLATGPEPGPKWMSKAALRLGDDVVGYRVRTRSGSKPVIAHAAWRTSPEVAEEIVLHSTSLARWPEPMRKARQLARELRARTPR
jgi:deoxyribonuclease V